MSIFASAAAALALVVPVTAHRPTWTLAHARAVLSRSDYAVADTSQPDAPRYHVVFTEKQARGLRRVGSQLVFAGTGHDGYTDADVAVHFTVTRANTLASFRGPAADTSQPAFPIRATFYYAWYPEAWTRGATFPYTFFHPTLDYYSSDGAAVVREQTEAMRYAHLNAAVYSWWGAQSDTDERFWRYLAAARTTPFRWAVYYEPEGYGAPSVARLRADLEYIRDTYAPRPAYLKVGGHFVVFVYGDAADACATAQRWHDANAGIDAYVVLKAFADFRSCPAQPSAWHEYSSDHAEYSLAPDSYMVSPAFAERREAAPRLARDPGRWRQDVADMVASGARWQLVETFNEWPEGTAVESAREWSSPSGFGTYLDALHDVLP
ncbi:MAG: hypothetical protein JF623_04780 [Acidobacteria bacterium]|nr:hypothetical protein [Acidobacteriota bacterium]